jgi:3-deoxy-D-manno-octulosonate 8-phosphate phosphatase (KDO 8-P phosphatase)
MSLTLSDRARRVKVLLFDVDGVLTNGDITIIPNAEGIGTEVKSFSAHDGLGISLARLAGLKIGFVTKRNSQVVAIRARDLKIDHVYQGQSHKMEAVNKILAAENCTLDELAYVGDDIIDLPVMRVVGLAIAVANARRQVKAVAHYVTPLPGGQGAGRDAIDFILTERGVLESTIEEYLDPASTESRRVDIGQGNM